MDPGHEARDDNLLAKDADKVDPVGGETPVETRQ